MRPGAAAGGAHLADDAAGGHGLRQGRVDGFQVSVEREQALPVVEDDGAAREEVIAAVDDAPGVRGDDFFPDRKSTRLNSSHRWRSYAAFRSTQKKHGATSTAESISSQI